MLRAHICYGENKLQPTSHTEYNTFITSEVNIHEHLTNMVCGCSTVTKYNKAIPFHTETRMPDKKIIRKSA